MSKLTDKLKDALELVNDFLDANTTRIYLTIIAGVAVFAIYKYSLLFEAGRINVYETRFYIVLFMTLFVVLILSVARVYNAIVYNSGRLIRLSEELKKFSASLKLERASLNNARTKLATALQRLIKALTFKSPEK